jgi:hypothetical protein
MWLLIVLALVVAQSVASKCNRIDAAIYKQKGHLFPSAFRALGGMTVSKQSYEAGVTRVMGLSASCAQCYGNAYLCGYNHCFWSCSSAGRSCDVCLLKEGCLEACNQCTGF